MISHKLRIMKHEAYSLLPLFRTGPGHLMDNKQTDAVIYLRFLELVWQE